ncbi:MAG TPA: glycosyltransferase family 2 protein, partial [Firmicutes bacterium]|nr:glycosyltransferase family 2 protein [Bacillota bacterium]
MTDVSIIIPVKNGERYLKQVLSSIFLQITDLNYEVIVIDSGSSDRSLEIISGFPVRLIKIAPRDFGHGKTRNYGASFAKGKIIVFITQDAVPKGRYWLSNLIKTYSMDEKLAGVYCRQIPRPFENPVSVEGIRNWIAGKDEFKITEISSEAEYNRLSSLEKRLLINFDNVASSMKKSVWEQFRLPEATFAADHQWAKNVLLNGYKIAFQPESTVVHSHDRNAAYEFKRRFIDHKINYQ